MVRIHEDSVDIQEWRTGDEDCQGCNEFAIVGNDYTVEGTVFVSRSNT